MNVRISVISVLLALSAVCAGQESSQLADEPIFIARFNGWTQDRFAEYLRELNRDLQVGSKITEAIEKSKKETATSTVETPVSGFLVYMRRGLIPAAEQIQYSEVASQDEFEKLVRMQKTQAGNSSVVEGSGDKFKLDHTTVVEVEITDEPLGVTVSDDDGGIPVKQVSASTTDAPVSESQDVDIPEGHQTTAMIGPFGVSSSTTDSTGRIVEIDGRRFRTNSYTNTRYYRYHDGFMFTGDSDVVWEMNPPSTAVLRDQNDGELNGQLSFYPDRIPMGFRQLGWDVLNAAAGTELQQHDDEPVTDYAWRRAWGKAGLSQVQAVMFDTQEITGWMKFAQHDEPVRGELKIAARTNSNLAKTLLEIAAADSRFAPILNDTAAATLHVALNLPDDWKEAGVALRDSYAAELSDDADAASLAALDIIHSATSCSDHGTLEAMVKLGWSQESGGVIYGGLQVDENPNLLNTILTMISTDATSDEPYELIQKGDLQLLKITMPVDDSADFVRLSHAYIAHADSCVWFAVGGENADEMIRLSLERCREAGGRIRTPLLTAAIDFDRLLASPQDDATGLTAIWPFCFTEMESLMREYAPFGSEPDQLGRESDIAVRALQLGGSKSVNLALAADESGLLLRGTLGTALLRSLLAPVVQMLDNGVSVTNDPM